MSNLLPQTESSSDTGTHEPAAMDAARRAGELALRIAEIAASHDQLTHMTKALAELLVTALDVERTAFFWRRTREHATRGSRPALQRLASASRTVEPQAEQAEHLKVAAYRALSRASLVSRTSRDAQTGEAEHTLALPVGLPAPWAILVVSWHEVDASAARDSRRAPLLVRLAPSLSTATRAAHVMAEAAYARDRHPQRRTIFTISSEAILTIGEDFVIEETNPAFGRVTGWEEQAVNGRSCHDVLRCRDDRGLLLCDTARCPLSQAFSNEGTIPVYELSWEMPDGKRCEVSASFTVQQIGEERRAVVVARDVRVLNAANRMRANFISMVSHELRTPLNSLNGFLEIVLEEQTGPLNEQQKEFLGYVRISTQQLTTLVEDILFISKADSGQFALRLEDVGIPALVDQVLHTLRSAAEKAQVKLVASVESDLPAIRADMLRLQQVLTNLLNNALKFSPEESTVRLEARRQADAILFAVRDSGVGISPEDHARIFERFYQSNSGAESRTGGYGLGLAIAKLIVEQHRGRIWVESEPGQGATFYFTVPISSASIPSMPAFPAPISTATPSSRRTGN